MLVISSVCCVEFALMPERARDGVIVGRARDCHGTEEDLAVTGSEPRPVHTNAVWILEFW